MIVWDRITQLREELGEDDFQEIVTLFLEEVDEAVGQLGPGLKGADLASHMHFLAGSALNLGFDGFAKLCQENEKAALRGGETPPNFAPIVQSYTVSRKLFLSGLAKERS